MEDTMVIVLMRFVFYNNSLYETEFSKRFMRFVSTSAILERFVTIEREISQIEKSIQANELANIADRKHEEDAFGASRLREAIINFKELCKKKHADRLWMEELCLT